MTNTYVPQVDGDHYQADYQHWDLMVDLGQDIDYFRATCLKYLSRFRSKNGARDLAKAASYLRKLAAAMEHKRYDVKAIQPSSGCIQHFYTSIKATPDVIAVMNYVFTSTTPAEMTVAAGVIERMEV